jgi:hypothetical protein
MVKLPSRKELAAKIDELESRLIDFTAGVGTGAVLATSPAARGAATTGLSRVSPYALAADAIIRQDESIVYRVGDRAFSQAEILAEGFAAKEREMGVSPERPLAFSPATPVAKPKRKKKSKFNQAVSSGLKALKSSTSYGKKGKISNAKAAFKTATKAASARLKGKKMPKAGPAKVAFKGAKSVYTDAILREIRKR